MSAIREVKEGKQYQGVDEYIAYNITTTPWGSTPTSVAVKAFLMGNPGTKGTDVTATVLTGSASVTGDIITLPALSALTLGRVYRVEVKFTCSGNIFEAFFWVEAEE